MDPRNIQYRTGDVFQINEDFSKEKENRGGWVGAFLLATEIKSWGVQGFVHHIETHAESSQTYVRIKWEFLEYIGHAVLTPNDLDES